MLLCLNKSSIKSLFRSTNHSCESLTERERRRSTAENLDINTYLSSLQMMSDRKDIDKRIFKNLIQNKTKKTPLKQNLFASNSVKELNQSTQQSASRQKPFTRARFASQRSTILGKQAQAQDQYDEQNSEKLQLLNESLFKLVGQLLKLKDEMNNNRKFQLQIYKLIGLKKTLQKLLFNLETQTIIEPLTVYHLKQNICIKEHVMDGTTLLNLDTYNFNIIRDINFLIEKIDELQIQTEANGIRQLEYKITDEIYNLKMEQNKMKHKRVQSPKLLFQQRIMRNQLLPEGSMEQIEQKFGPFPLIQNKNKIIHNQIQTIINNLNIKFKY
ncbi:unnamed protein product [Paramecium primaurelia]|uniref:Uncharacterized protein n=1 Tax=Paramecium primaurelia TaxID=5886 RepID=A0A8S1NXH5_PARPR|nr:unnamed protein product [Paramecium primaurelia]